MLARHKKQGRLVMWDGPAGTSPLLTHTSLIDLVGYGYKTGCQFALTSDL